MEESRFRIAGTAWDAGRYRVGGVLALVAITVAFAFDPGWLLQRPAPNATLASCAAGSSVAEYFTGLTVGLTCEAEISAHNTMFLIAFCSARPVHQLWYGIHPDTA